jgi:hypothetical protein
VGLIQSLPGGLGAALERELRLGFQFDKANCEARQGKLGQVNKEKVKAVEGLGSLEARIDSTSYHFWGQKLGYDCWKDKQFKREYLRDNPQAKVNCGGTRLQVGFGS